MRIRPLVVGALLWAVVAAVPVVGVVPSASGAVPSSFSFGAAGDFGANSSSGATLTALSTAGTDLFFALGDLSYSETTESGWCNFVKSKVGSTYPFELIAGNHEAAGSADGAIANFAACLPNRLGPLTGKYAQEGYVDYPTAQPLARFITISPNLAFPGEATYRYTLGSAHYTWLSSAIDGARAAGIRWVIVAMHETCMTSGNLGCSIGADLQNLLVGKKVDLVLQAHEHSYQRSKQLALGGSCPAVPVNSYQAGCVADDGSDNAYTKGAGTVVVIAGTGGEGLVSMNSSDPERPYFAKVMGSNSNPTKGFMKYTVTDTQLSASFVRSSGGTFTDSFTINAGAGTTPPSAANVSAVTAAATPVPVTLQGSDAGKCDLAFSIVAGPAHGTLSPLTDQPCTGSGPFQDSAAITYTPTSGFAGSDSFSYRVNNGTADSNTATATVTVNPPPGVPMAADVSATTTAATPVTVTLRGSDAGQCELTFSVVTVPSHGTLSAPINQPCSGSGPFQDTAAITYTPGSGFTGSDSFTYRVNNGTADSATATAAVTVNPASAGIKLRSASSGQNPTSTSLTLARPAGAAPGDVLLAAVAVRGTTTIAAPAGWTLVRLDNAANYTIQAVYWHVVAAAGEPSSYQWGFSSSNAAAGGILDYSGVNTSAPIEVHGGAVNGGATTSIVAPSITTTVAGDRVVGMFGIGGSNSITPPSGMTEEGEASSTAGNYHVTWEGSDYTPAVGPTGSKTAGATIAHPSVGQLIALRPA